MAAIDNIELIKKSYTYDVLEKFNNLPEVIMKLNNINNRPNVTHKKG